MHVLRVAPLAVLGVALLAACDGNNDGPSGPPPGSVDLSGGWPELWINDGSGGEIVPAGGAPAPSITLSADALGYSGAACYLESNGVRTLAEVRLTVQGPDVVGGELAVSRWYVEPIPGDCAGQPDSERGRLSVLGAYVEDGPVRVVGSWIRPSPAGLDEGTFTLERAP